jgi:hypothetical protein
VALVRSRPGKRIAAGLLLLLAFVGVLPVRAQGMREARTGTIDPLYPGGRHPEVGFAGRTRLREHFEKHGREFGAADATAYLRLAQEMRDRRPGGALLEFLRADGVLTRFDRRTGSFLAFEKSLVIRTFFKPNDGEAYFKRQQRRIPRQP